MAKCPSPKRYYNADAARFLELARSRQPNLPKITMKKKKKFVPFSIEYRAKELDDLLDYALAIDDLHNRRK